MHFLLILDCLVFKAPKTVLTGILSQITLNLLKATVVLLNIRFSYPAITAPPLYCPDSPGLPGIAPGIHIGETGAERGYY